MMGVNSFSGQLAVNVSEASQATNQGQKPALSVLPIFPVPCQAQAPTSTIYLASNNFYFKILFSSPPGEDS
jgi:hypothetical protein